MQLNHQQTQLHSRALELCKEHRELEWQIISVLQQIERSKLYQKFGVTSLFQYCVTVLDMSEAAAYMFITVARKSQKIKPLSEAIRRKTLSVSKASRIVPKITEQNAKQLIAFAEGHTSREIDQLLSPEGQVTVRVPKATLAKLKRAQSVLAGNLDLMQALDAVLEDFLERHDPVRKAERAQLRPNRVVTVKKSGITQEKSIGDRLMEEHEPKERNAPPLTAEQRHAVFARDKGRCTFIDANGKRCTNERWVHIHHIHPKAKGGGNEVNNLTTLCSTHHDLVHQMSLPLEGQISWLKAPSRAYGASLAERNSHCSTGVTVI